MTATKAILQSLFLTFFEILLFAAFSTVFAQNNSGGNGVLRLQCERVGLSVYVDGKLLGKTPLPDIELPVGVHSVRISPPGSNVWFVKHWQKDVEIKQGELASASVNFELPLSINSQPYGAQVVVNGKPAGISPAFILLQEGKNVIHLSLPGYADSTFAVLGGGRKAINIALRKSIAILKPTLEPEATSSFRKNKTKVATAIGVSALTGAMALYFRSKADDNYNKYLKTGKPDQFEKFLGEAKKYDKYALGSYAVFQVSFVFSFYLLLKQADD